MSISTSVSTWRLTEFSAAHPDHCLNLRYEELVNDPAGQLSRICDFLQAPADVQRIVESGGGRGAPGLGDWKTYQTAGISDRSVGRWRSLPTAVVARLAPIVNPVLELTGYEKVASPREPSGTAARRALQLSLMAATLRKPAAPDSSGDP